MQPGETIRPSASAGFDRLAASGWAAQQSAQVMRGNCSHA